MNLNKNWGKRRGKKRKRCIIIVLLKKVGLIVWLWSSQIYLTPSLTLQLHSAHTIHNNHWKCALNMGVHLYHLKKYMINVESGNESHFYILPNSLVLLRNTFIVISVRKKGLLLLGHPVWLIGGDLLVFSLMRKILRISYWVTGLREMWFKSERFYQIDLENSASFCFQSFNISILTSETHFGLLMWV